MTTSRVKIKTARGEMVVETDDVKAGESFKAFLKKFKERTICLGIGLGIGIVVGSVSTAMLLS